jgi:hypothetical protein
MFNNQKQYWEPPLGDNLQWKNREPTLRNPTATIIETWPVKYGDWLVNSVSRVPGKSYLTLPRGTNEEPTT